MHSAKSLPPRKSGTISHEMLRKGRQLSKNYSQVQWASSRGLLYRTELLPTID